MHVSLNHKSGKTGNSESFRVAGSGVETPRDRTTDSIIILIAHRPSQKRSLTFSTINSDTTFKHPNVQFLIKFET